MDISCRMCDEGIIYVLEAHTTTQSIRFCDNCIIFFSSSAAAAAQLLHSHTAACCCSSSCSCGGTYSNNDNNRKQDYCLGLLLCEDTAVSMGLAEGASSLFGLPTPVKEAGEEQRLRRREEDRRKKGRRSLFSQEQDKNNNDALDARKRSKRTWPIPWSVEKLQEWLHAEKKTKSNVEKKRKEVAYRGGGKQYMTPARCCSLDCAARFCSTVDDDSTQLYNPAFLRNEQAMFATLAWEKDRKAFVIAGVPPVKLFKGSMMAANTPVWNLAFRKLFGVSETLISACKQTPGARASSSTERYEVNGDTALHVISTTTGR